jgi:hypothetical protein
MASVLKTGIKQVAKADREANAVANEKKSDGRMNLMSGITKAGLGGLRKITRPSVRKGEEGPKVPQNAAIAKVLSNRHAIAGDDSDSSSEDSDFSDF